MVEREPLHRRLALFSRRLPLSRKRRRCRRTRCWGLCTERATRHCRCTIHKVAKVIRELGVIATNDRVPAHLAIAVKWNLAQRNEARTIGAERCNGAIRIKEVAAALTHPLTAREEPAVHPDALRRLKARAPEHRWPEDRVKSIDVLTDDVQIRWPPWRTLRIRWEAGASEIVDERVVPDIDRSSGWIAASIRVKRTAPVLANRERDPPGCTLTTDGKVFETLPNKSEHLVAAVFRLHRRQILRQPGLKSLLVGAQSEEPVALLEPLQRHAGMIRADALAPLFHHVAFSAESFVGAVPALIRAEIDVASGE